AQARARRRVQWVAAALLIGVLLAGTAAVVALHESATANHQRRLAEARSLVAASTQQLGTDPELSLVLAGEAAKRARTPEVRDALRAALQSPIRLTLRGHRGSIDGLVVSADGRPALTSSDQEPTRVWDLRTGTGGVLGGLAGRGSFSPDGKLVVGATRRSALRIWDASTLRAVGAPFPALHKQVPAAAFSPDGRRILSWSSDHGVMLWDVRTRRRLHLLGDAPGPMPRATVEPVQIDAAFGRDGRLVATVADGRGLEVWDAASGRRLWRHDGWYSGVEFDAAGRRLLTSDYTAGTPNPPVARLWSVAGRRQVASFSPRHGADVAAFAGDDGHVLVDDRLWDPATGDAIRLGSGPYFIDERPRSQAASADGMIVVSAGIGRAEVSDGDTGRRLGTLDAGTSSVTATGLAADGRTILTGHANGTVEVWDRRVVRLRPAGKLVSAVAVSPDGRRIAGLTRSYRVVVWDAATGRIRLRSRHVVLRCGETDLCGPSIQFSADGRRLHVVVGGVAVVLDPATGVTIGKPIATGAQHVAFSRDGRRVAYSDDGEAVRVADAATGATVSRVPVTNGGVGGLALATDGGLGGYTLSTDGEILAINDGPDGLSLWSTASRKRLGRLAGDVSVLDQYGSVALSRDGTRAAAARTDGTTSIVRTDGGRELLRLAGHRGPVLETDFSPDGRFVVTSGSDGTTRVFDAADGRTVATFGSAGAVAMTSDDRRVVVVGERGLPLVYPCEACATWPELAKRVAARTHRALSAAERARFLGG
ncbi:MAG: hypothetical protein QOG94_967, partial [Solirubrobacteraceae bacterium]|nr:hypothetical protein [Solirubrobacteraceae bacterium]